MLAHDSRHKNNARDRRTKATMSSNRKETDDDSVLDMDQQTMRPPDKALHQQRVNAWHPILDPVWVIIALFYLGVILVPVGTLLAFCCSTGML